MIGRTLGHYRIVEQIGAGGVGVVYRARDERLDRDVAIKVLPAGTLEDPSARTRFRREALALSRINHPRVATIHDFNTEQGVDFLVTEFVAGETLQARLAMAGALAEPVWIAIATQIAEALRAAHAQGMVHRDLKPGNVMLTPDGGVKLLDFGLAELFEATEGAAPLSSSTHSGGWIAGTLPYMAPEQVLGRPLDARADLYSLGVVMFEMATGRLPFSHRNPAALILAIGSHPPPSPRSLHAGITPGAEQVILTCLEKDPGDRYVAAQMLIQALGEAETARLRDATRRRRRLAMAALVVVAALSGLLFLPRRAALSPKRVAIAVFTNGTGDPALESLGPMAADWITQGLSRTALVDVVPAQLVLQTSQPERRHGADVVRLLAEETGAALVVTGTYYLENDSLRFQTRLSDAIQGQLLQALDPIATPRAAPLEGVETLRRRVMAALARQTNPRLSSWVNVTREPPSFEAYEEYVEGEERYVRRDWQGAIEHYYRASARDPGYAYPLLQACAAHLNLGHPAQIDSITRVLAPAAERMAPLDRQVYAWLLAGLRGDLESSYEIARRAAELAPGSLWPYQRALQALLLGRPREVVEVLSRIDPERGAMRDWAPYWNLLTDGYHMLGDYPHELTAARRARRQYPALQLPFYLEARALVGMGRTAEVRQVMDDCLNVAPDPGASSSAVLLSTARELRAHGDPTDAQAMADRAVAMLRTEAAEDSSRRPALVAALYAARRWDECRPFFESDLARNPRNVHALGFVGVLAARRGDRARAAACAEALASLREPYVRGANTYWEAEIAALLGDRPQALARLHEAFREGQPVPTRAHSDPDLEALRDDPDFKRLLRPRG